MKPRKTPPTKGLAAVVHARLVRLLNSIEDGIESFMEQVAGLNPVLFLSFLLFITARSHGESWGDYRAEFIISGGKEYVASTDKAGPTPEAKVINKSVPHSADFGADALMILVDVGRMSRVDLIKPTAHSDAGRPQAISSCGVASQVVIPDCTDSRSKEKHQKVTNDLGHRSVMFLAIGIVLGWIGMALFNWITLRPFLPNV